MQSTELSNTFGFWIQHINHVNLCLTLRKAVTTIDFHVYQYCLIQVYDFFLYAMVKIKPDTLLFSNLRVKRE